MFAGEKGASQPAQSRGSHAGVLQVAEIANTLGVTPAHISGPFLPTCTCAAFHFGLIPDAASSRLLKQHHSLLNSDLSP